MSSAGDSAGDPLAVRLLYSPQEPEPPQHAFLWTNRLEALYGGAAGGGKSSALLMAALQYVDVPGYAALLLRRTYADLALPGALMDRAHAWLASTPAKWSQADFRWTFPSGASLSFGYLQYSTDKYRYASAEFQFIGFDELTQFPEADYRFLFSRLRRPSGLDDDNPLAGVPLRMRGASNPGGLGHEWVRRRLIAREVDPDDPGDTAAKARRRVFIPAKLSDNPHVDQESYLAALGELTELERRRLLDGDWYADDGTIFYPGAGIDAALNLGAELDRQADRGTIPPPVGELVGIGLDWGDVSGVVIGYPLEAGGLYVVAAEELAGLDAGAVTERTFALVGDTVPAWEGAPTVRDPLELVDAARYDAAGAQSMRTFTKLARLRIPRFRVTKIPFGSYKREATAYTRLLLERARDGHSTRVLAISPTAAAVLARQMRAQVKDPRDPELPVKGDDHVADALTALIAPIARRNRDRGRGGGSSKGR